MHVNMSWKPMTPAAWLTPAAWFFVLAAALWGVLPAFAAPVPAGRPAGSPAASPAAGRAAPSGPGAKRAGKKTDVWLDVDTANGVGEIDDGLMLIQAFHSPEVRVHGVSAVFGNTDLAHVYPIAYNIVRSFGPEGLKVYKGAASADDLGNQTPAVRAMAAALKKQPLTLVATGPVTNVATLVKRHPDLCDRIQRIVMVAARRPGQRFVYFKDQKQSLPDANFEHDPAAMQVLLDTKIPLVFAPWEVSSHVWLTREDFEGLRKTGGSGQFIYDTSQIWLRGWREGLGKAAGNPFDTLALGWVTHPQLLQAMKVTAHIEQHPHREAGDEADASETSGRGEKPWLVVNKAARPERSILYCYRPKPAFKAMLMRRLSGPDHASGRDEGTR